MQSKSQPAIFESLSTKLTESGAIDHSQNGVSQDLDGSQPMLQTTTLLLVSLIALQLQITAASIYEENVHDWKRKYHEAEKSIQILQSKITTLEGESVSMHSEVEELKHEAKAVVEKERARRSAMVDVGVNTNSTKKADMGTNTEHTLQQHKSTSTDLIPSEEIGVNTDSAPSQTQDSSVANILLETNAETESSSSTTELLMESSPTVHETQQIELLKKEIHHLKEVINKLNNIPAQRVIVTTWEKNYLSDLQGPLLRYINASFTGHPHLAHVLPANPDKHINRVTHDGVLLCLLVNLAHPGILDERVINFVPTSDLEVMQNFTLTINTAMAMGCSVPTTNPELLLSDPQLMIEFVYQLVKSELFSKLNLENHPEFVRLRKDNETPAKFRCVGPSEILQRWTERLLPPKASCNIGTQSVCEADLRHILSKLSPSQLASGDDWIDAFSEQVNFTRPALLLPHLVGNIPLQLLFLAQVAHAVPDLAPLSDSERKRETEEVHDIDPEGTREERAFVTWINGLGIPIPVSNLQYDMNDGLVLLHTLDKIERGSINWKEANSNPNNAYKKVENCNLGLKVCVNKFNFSLVGIGGKDLFDGKRKLILAVIWQACKYHLLAALRTCGNGVEVTEADVLAFLNKRIPQPVSSFKDASLRTALPLLDLLLHLAPNVVKQDNVRRRCPVSPEDCVLNAKYAIGLARKIFVLPSSGSSLPNSTVQSSSSHPPTKPSHDIPICLPILPEDIVEVKPKMLFIFVSMMMLIDKVSPYTTDFSKTNK